MPSWAYSIISGLAVGLLMLLINKLTTKSAAQLTQEIAKLHSKLEEIEKDVIKDGWSTDQKLALERRLTIIESKTESLIVEVNFTQTSHQEFLRLLERALIPIAHSPHTPELDRLLEKRDAGEELNSDEWEDLLRRLEEQSAFYDAMPGKKIALKGLRAIYMTHLRQAKRRENSMNISTI